MKTMIKSIISMIAAALATAVGYAGDSAPFRLDTMEGTRVARETETIAYSTEWDNCGKVIVAVDGVTLKEAVAPASGNVTWDAGNASVGTHTLTYTTYKNGVADKIETVTFTIKAIVTFDTNGGSLGTASSTRLVDAGTAIGTLPIPSRTGYTFAGWWTAASGGSQVSESTTVSDRVTYYAHWTINQYTVSFNSAGGTTVNPITQDFESAITRPANPEREGYTFTGWSPAVPSTMPANNITCTAQWQINQYTVSFNSAGGTTVKPITQDYASTITPPANPTREGYTFMGWLPDVPSTMPANNTTCVAQWKINQYTVTFEGNGGALGERALPRVVNTQDYGTVIVEPTRTREWFDFSGWSPAVAATVPANDVTYTAQWKRWGDSISVSKMGGKTMKQLYPDDYTTMTKVVLEEGITELPTGFFDGCDNMEFVTWPSTLVEFGIDDLPPKIRATEEGKYDEDGFLIYNNWILDYQNRNAASVTIPEGIVGIGRRAFAAMYDLETVTMPESLRCIAKGAFEDCSWIQNLQFMSGLRYVGPVAFRGCSSLLGASFADGVEILGTNVFEDCWQMQSVRLPYTVTNIGVKTFTGCSAIRGVTVPTHLKTMQNLFPASYSQIETAEVAEGETTVMDDMFAGCVALRGGATQTDMSMIPNTVTNIGARAFQGCTNLTAFVVPDSVAMIGESVFQGCSALWNVTLSRSLTEIPDYAFYGCSVLETMVVPESVTYLGDRFFSGRTAGQANALYYLCTNAPVCHPDAYAAIDGNMTTYVLQDSRSWDGRQGSRVLPQSWNGYPITSWTPNRFDVTFDANGGQFDSMGGSTWSEQQITDTSYALPSTEPVRSGWAFEGWWTDQTGGAEVKYTTKVTATRPHTIYAHWRSLGNRMTVTFNSNGGTVVVPGTQDYVPGQTFGQFPVPTRRGYTFQGWWTESAGGIRMTEATEVPSANMELFAHWEPITYYVRFHANGGVGADVEQTFVYDVRQRLATNTFTRTGFAFTGWATTPSGQVRYAENASVVNLEEVQDYIVDLYAVWSGVGYSVRFDSNGGTGIMDNQTIAVGETQNLWPCAYARGGYTFAGWALSPTDAEAKKVKYLDGAAVRNLATSNGAIVPLYAVWVTGTQTVRITFDANGGSVAPNNYWDCVVGTAVEAFPTPTRPGFTFAGWWTERTGGTRMTSIARVTSAQTFYAHWTGNGDVDPGDNLCTVTFNANGGSVTPTTRKVPSGTVVGTLPKPSRTGYAFTGWWTAANGGVQIADTYVVNSSVTFYAHWVADEIAISTEESYETNPDGSFTLALGDLVFSGSTPKITVKGLPTGLKYDAKTMTIGGTATKPGVYTVTVSAVNATVKKPVTATFDIVVPNLKSEMLPNLVPEGNAYGTIHCGVAFDPELVDCTPRAGWTVKVAGLPSGLKYDAKTGRITGVPTKAGTFTVTFTASKKGEKNQIATITLAIAVLPDWATGSFTGYVRRSRGDAPYHDAYGFATMTVAANGKVSGKIALDGTNWTFSAASYAVVECPSSDVADASFIVEATAKAGKLTRSVSLAVRRAEDGRAGRAPLPDAVAEGSFGDGEVKMWRNMWKDKATAAAAKAEIARWEGVYTLSMEDGGYMSLTIGKKGDVKASGKLSDGTSVSATSPLMYDVDEGWFVLLYAAPSAYKGGCLALAVGFDASAPGATALSPVMFEPQWTSRNPQATGEYGGGFDRSLSFTGAYYNKAKLLSDYYGAVRLSLDAVPELAYTYKYSFIGGSNKKETQSYQQTATAVNTLWQGGLTAVVDGKGKIVVAKATKPVQDKESKEWFYEGANDGAMALSFTQATGIFKGSYTFWYDYESAYDDTKWKTTMAHVSKKVSFEGVMVQGEASMRGFYLWNAMGAYEDPKTGKEKTYKYKESYRVRCEGQ